MNSTAPITYESPEAGVMLVTFVRSPSDDEFRGYLARLTTNLENNKDVATIIRTVRGLPPTSPVQRKLQAEWIKTHREKLDARSAGTVFVLDSVIHRFALSSILLLQDIPGGYAVVATLEEALAWFRGHARR